MNCRSENVGETVLFPEFGGSTESRFMTSGQVEVSLRGNDQVLVLFASLEVEGDVMANDVPVVGES